MATLPAASALDLSRLPAFKLVTVDYEAERAEILERVRQRLTDQNHPFDPTQEADPIVILSEEVAYTRTLGLQALNDSGHRLTVAYGYGPALDHVGATFYADLGDAARRLPDEPDERYRRRLVLAASARSPGSLAGYMFWALTLGPKLIDAQALNHASGLVAPGVVAVIVLGDAADDGPDGEAAQLAAVTAGLNDVERKLGTDTLQIRAATRIEVALQAVLELEGAGPDPGLVIEEASRQFARFRAERHKVGAGVSRTSLGAALTVGGMLRVRFESPVADVIPPPDGVVDFSSVSITAEIANG